MRNSFDRLLTAAAELQPEEARSQSSLARFLEESPQSLTNWKATGIVPRKKLLKIAGKIGCNPYWLETGLGAMVDAKQQNFPLQRHGMYDVDVSAGYPVDTRVPVYTWAEISGINKMQKEKAETGREYLSTPIMATPQGSFALKIEQQQFKSIPPGSYVVFSPGGAWIDGAIAIIRTAGNFTLRRLRLDGSLRLLIAHDEAPWQTEPFDQEHDELFATKEVTILIDKR